MTNQSDSPLATSRLKKAVKHLSELIEEYPEKKRQELLHEIQLKFDLTPLECEFLNKYLSEEL